MPAYEYICDKCHQAFSYRIPYEKYNRQKVACPNCGSKEVTRRIGKVRVGRSESTRNQQLEELTDLSRLDTTAQNPSEIGKMMRTMEQESGADLGDAFDEVVDRLEHGQNAADLEKDMPDLTEED